MADRVGQQLGNYRLVRLLGQGSFGDVYLGKHVHDNTTAAVKVLQTRLTPEDLKLFINEAGTSFKLQHPNIVQLLDFGIDANNTPFLVMAYAPNGTLRQRYPRGTRLPLDIIVPYVNQVAAALQYAHDKRLIHRDVKPENMLLGPNDEVLLSDFGLAHLAHSTFSQSEVKMAGTIPYMAPEQIQSHPRPASDQYALGVVVYEWLCGDRPFEGTLTDVAVKQMMIPPPPLHEKIPTIAPEVEQVVMTALAKDPRQRFDRVQAFATALEQASQAPKVTPSHLPIMVTPPNRAPRPSELVIPPDQSAPPSELIMRPEHTAQATGMGITSNHTSQPPNLWTPASGVPNATPPVPQSQHIGKASHVEHIGRPAPPSPPATRSPGSGLSSLFTEADNALAKFFSHRGSKNQQETELSLFAIARTTLEADDRAIVGKVYTVQAGISQYRSAEFRGEPFRVSVQNPAEPLLFGILLHPSENIELMGTRYQPLRYDPRNVEPQFIACPFRVKVPGRGYLVINFYRERQWLKTMRFEVDSIEQSVLSTAMRGG